MSDFDYRANERRETERKRLRRNQDWRGHRYETRTCIRCGGDVCGPVSRVSHLLFQHAQRCDQATPEARLNWRRTGRWPRAAARGDESKP
jgi:hypothetical protein